MRRFETIAGAAAVGVLATVVLCTHLGGYALWDPDEARHSEIARQIFTASDWRGWLLPRINGRPYYDKPILFYWLVAGAYALGGVGELTARSVPVIAALTTILAIYAWAARAWGVRAALWAAVVLITAGEFPALGRYANLDMLLTLWVTLGLLSVHHWIRRVGGAGGAPASLVPAAACGALGMLTKGLVAPVLIGGIGVLYLALTGQLRLLARARWLRTLCTFILVAGPWYVTVGILDSAYLEEFFLRHHYQRFFEQTRYLHPGPIYYYIPVLVLCFFPWSMLLPATVRGTLSRERRDAETLFCACWTLGVVAFFSLAQGKLGTYILPAIPPLALLTGRYLDRLTRTGQPPSTTDTADRRLVSGGMLIAATLCIVACPVVLALSARIYDGAWMRTSTLATVLLPFGATLIALVRSDRHRVTPAVLALTFVVALVVFYRWGAPAISAVRSEEPLARVIAQHAPASTVAPLVAFRVRTPSLLFYTRRAVRDIDQPRRLARVLAKHPLVFVITSPKHVPVLRQHVTLFPWHTTGRHILYASRPLPTQPLAGGPRSPAP